MARYGVTYDDVSRAANDLLLQKKNPTIESVRHFLGGTGSFSTIGKFLNQWKSERLLSSVQDETQKVAFVPERVGQAVSEMWDKLQQEAQAKLDQLQFEYEEKLTSLTEEKENYRQQLERQAMLIEQQKTKINHLHTDLQLLKNEYLELQQQQAVLNETLQNQDKYFKQMLDDKDAQITLLNHNYQFALDSFRNTQHQSDERYKQELDTFKTLLENQRVQFMVKNTEIQTAKENTEKSLNKITLELRDKNHALQAVLEKNKLLEIDSIMIRTEQTALKKEHGQLISQCNQNEKELIKLATLCEQKDILISELNIQNKQLAKLVATSKDKSSKS